MPRVAEAVQVREGPLARVATELIAPSTDESTAPPGAIVAMAFDGRTEFAVAGLAQREPAEPMTWTARTDAGSVTKIVATTAALMALVDSGQIRVDDAADRYIPALADRDITIRHLLEHRAGLWEWWPLYLSGARGVEAVEQAIELPARYPVGAGRRYSDLGFVLLGDIVARVCAMPLREAVQRLVFDPFGLTSTRYATPASGGPPIASSDGDKIERRMIDSGVPYPVTGSTQAFTRWRSHVLAGEVNDGNAFHAFDGVAGHAGLFTTAADLLRFAEMLRAALDEDGLVRQETPRAFMSAGAEAEQALGFRIWSDEHGRAIGHTGFPGVAFAVLPDERASLVMITNRLHAPGVPDSVEPRAIEPMWKLVRDAARNHLAGRDSSSTPKTPNALHASEVPGR